MLFYVCRMNAAVLLKSAMLRSTGPLCIRDSTSRAALMRNTEAEYKYIARHRILQHASPAKTLKAAANENHAGGCWEGPRERQLYTTYSQTALLAKAEVDVVHMYPTWEKQLPSCGRTSTDSLGEYLDWTFTMCRTPSTIF